ncbi:hypothetical protein BGZ65_007325 [Modicella reniformis]|uniref:Uncharacterized protein n=1 Tax=Modicella reniformis TaxID=1440133 RepID=A0A9P6SSL1_9FUNG|nr:hypothetical protein BGZ65_007325 [Modicella reniformis]
MVALAVSLVKMKYHFDTNFAAYQGAPWRLPSGAIVDDVVAQLARQDGFESALQSFVLEDSSKIIALFPDQEDKDELHKVLVDRPEETLASLTAQEEAFIEQFGKTPQEVKTLLGQGWANLQEGAELDEDYKMLVHHCFQQLYLTYRHFHFSLPKDMKEAYYTDKIWGFMNVALDDVETLDHEPGEINSKSSGLRKNRDRTRQNRQSQGRKTDGLVSTMGASHELCIVEAAREEPLVFDMDLVFMEAKPSTQPAGILKDLMKLEKSIAANLQLTSAKLPPKSCGHEKRFMIVNFLEG